MRCNGCNGLERRLTPRAFERKLFCEDQMKSNGTNKDVLSNAPQGNVQADAQHQHHPLGFSLFMWGNDDAPGRDKYRLMLEGAKYFDRNDFEAVWTPERHFHAFGGPYPNPSVTGAALAAATERIGIR